MERKFKCEYCNKEYNSSTYIRTHILQKHKEEIIFDIANKLQCQVCGLKFNNSDNERDNKIALSTHINNKHCSTEDYNLKYYNIEKEVREIECELCGFLSKSSRGLGNHLSCTHNIKCNNLNVFISILNGYRDHCSPSCAMIDPKVKDEYLRVHGVSNPFQRRDVIDKISDNKNKDIDINGLNGHQRIGKKNKEWANKQTDEYWEEKIERSRNTCVERYGVTNAMQDPEISERCKKNSYKWKEYKFPSGKIIKVQGYEDKELDILLESYDENEILNKRSEVPEIWYYMKDGMKRRYFPDMYIEKDNLIIEVKSTWTITLDKEKIEAKRMACIEAGYNFKFMILDKKGKIVDL